MQRFAELFRRHLTGPRWEVTQDVLAQHPAVLADLLKSTEEDLLLLFDQIETGTAATDVRITLEHLVLLLGRLVPVIDSIIGDLYMTNVVDIEHESASETLPAGMREVARRLRIDLDRFSDGAIPQQATQSEEIRAILDTAVAVAAIHLECVTALRALIAARFEATIP